MRPILIGLAILGIAAVACIPSQQEDPKEKAVLTAIISHLDSLHYAPIPLDDSFSGKAFEYFLEETDPEQNIFNQEDLTKLHTHRLNIDDQIHSGSFEFLDQTLALMESKEIEQNRSEAFTTYLNSIMAIYGPHNSYMTPRDREDFDIQFNKRMKGVGMHIEKRENEIVITRIVPGGPAWNTQQFTAGDILTGVAQGANTFVDMAGKEIPEVVQYLRGEKGSEVRLTIKKEDQSMAIVPVIRDVVIMEAGLAKAFTLTDTRLGDKVGYVRLPRFYANFQDPDGPQCARDVLAAIESFNKDNLNGMVLDLRNNIGGSMQEAIKMMGYFLEGGPLVQVRSRDGSTRTYDDPDPAAQYEGALIVLTNGRSGSACDLLSATIQDYDRGLIVGDTTFGKGTVQNLISLDQPRFEAFAPLGDIKFTRRLFFRVNGGSTQLKGVEPDIALYDEFQGNSGERTFKYPLPWEEIESLDFHQDVNQISNRKLFLWWLEGHPP